jgi:Cache 3/Cache 2 fusion domain
MRLHRRVSGRVGKRIALALGLAFSGVLLAFVHKGGGSLAAAPAKIEATIFSYDGQDFVRTQTTLLTAEGKSAVNTKLDHETAGYKALSQKRSYTGEATVFGRKYDANYAPLISDDGRLTGALFVAVAK